MERKNEPCWLEGCSEQHEEECGNSSAGSLSSDAFFLKWITQKLGPVLLGAKPAELLCFRQSDQEK